MSKKEEKKLQIAKNFQKCYTIGFEPEYKIYYDLCSLLKYIL